MSSPKLSKLNVSYLKGCANVSVILFILELINCVVVLVDGTKTDIIFALSSLAIVFALMIILNNIAEMASQIEIIKHDIVEKKLGVSLSEYSEDMSGVPETRKDVEEWLASPQVNESESVEFECDSEEEAEETEDDELVTPETKEEIEKWMSENE